MLELNFSPFPELKTNRLLLRKMKVTDAPELLFLRSDEKVMQYIGREKTKTVEEAEGFIQTINASDILVLKVIRAVIYRCITTAVPISADFQHIDFSVCNKNKAPACKKTAGLYFLTLKLTYYIFGNSTWSITCITPLLWFTSLMVT